MKRRWEDREEEEEEVAVSKTGGASHHAISRFNAFSLTRKTAARLLTVLNRNQRRVRYG